MRLENRITDLKGIGEKSANLFHKLNIDTIEDLIHYFPRDYETFREPVTSGQAKEGEICTLRLVIQGTPVLKRVRNLSILNVTGQDIDGQVTITFFHMPFLKNVLRPGSMYLFRGQLQRKGTSCYMEHPRMYKEEEYGSLMSCIQPRYPLTKGVTNQMLTKAVKGALENCPMPKDPLPEDIRTKYGLPGYRVAFENIHFPEDMEHLVAAVNGWLSMNFYLLY